MYSDADAQKNARGAGFSSELLRFLTALDGMGLYTHSLLIAKGSRVLCEAYYAPFTADTLHRQYSVSKSFISGVRYSSITAR